ncbi:hypothetical protein C8F04DRAFT_973983 [Mycena alexandri]|uniref:BTB domain-containing protein n=1 Tax=Mycena alexandri TaxID=1745969 RepID=A0AAD6S6A8_9AGAR|nr:hypothetical protein C8F04DRAFT_973983 [Mycena alexandri]
MPDATAPPPFVPQAPFHGPAGDVILRSSDGIDFHVYRIVLSLASPIFEHMFSSSQPHSESGNLPVVSMAESAIIDILSPTAACASSTPARNQPSPA